MPYSTPRGPSSRGADYSATRLDDLPVVRLHPPGSTDWFIELLTSARPNSAPRDPERVSTSHGDLQLCGFPNLDLAAHQAPEVHGLRVALPAMLALVNLIGHVEESGRTMSMKIAGREMLRSSKDLGRVLALAHLAEAGDRDGTAGISTWPQLWHGGLSTRYPASLAEIPVWYALRLAGSVISTASVRNAWPTWLAGVGEDRLRLGLPTVAGRRCADGGLQSLRALAWAIRAWASATAPADDRLFRGPWGRVRRGSG